MEWKHRSSRPYVSICSLRFHMPRKFITNSMSTRWCPLLRSHQSCSQMPSNCRCQTTISRCPPLGRNTLLYILFPPQCVQMEERQLPVFLASFLNDSYLVTRTSAQTMTRTGACVYVIYNFGCAWIIEEEKPQVAKSSVYYQDEKSVAK
jgi:hypothetical protein